MPIVAARDVPFRKHLVFLGSFGSIALMSVSMVINLMEHGRSFKFVLLWGLGFAILPLYVTCENLVLHQEMVILKVINKLDRK